MASKLILLRVCMFKVGDNKGTISRMNCQGHFRDLKVRSLGILTSLLPIQCSLLKSNSRDRCSFCNDKGYKTNGHFSLKDAIDEVIRHGELRDFIGQETLSSGQSWRDADKGKHGGNKASYLAKNSKETLILPHIKEQH
ncbi:hypothetical protein J1N35_028731 [Gossypium stocksii]|uniref:Uncharacterized protein n=1 Tax=Gossypium stocksii TaxID=47602 RepID=A0A9D3ZSA2_9ROSI|nr:hypothetical protein J1N35_028731 [Gossypium stocksii]